MHQGSCNRWTLKFHTTLRTTDLSSLLNAVAEEQNISVWFALSLGPLEVHTYSICSPVPAATHWTLEQNFHLLACHIHLCFQARMSGDHIWLQTSDCKGIQ